jgi:Flp pilus assembly pilin Flp
MFHSFTRAFSNFREREDGLTAVEYAVMAGLVVIGVCIAAFTARSATRGDGFIMTFRGNTRNGAATSNLHRASRRAVTDATDQNGIEIKAAVGDRANTGDFSVTGGTSDRKADTRNRNVEASPKPAGADSIDHATSPEIAGSARGTDSGPVEQTDDSVKSFEKKKGTSAAASAASGSSDAAGMSEEDARLAILGLLTVYPHMFATTAETVETAAIVHQKDYISIASFRCHLKSRRFAYHPPATSKNGASVYGVFYQKADGAWTGRITNTVR